MQAELKQGVDTIYSTQTAYAARMGDVSVVVTWGSDLTGGDSRLVQAAVVGHQIRITFVQRQPGST